MNLKIWTGATTENPGLSEKMINRLKSNMEEWQQQVRIFGNYAMGLGRCAFSESGLLIQRDSIKEPIEIRNISESSKLFIYEYPVADFGYAIGVDTAKGLEHSDNSVIFILKRDTMPTRAIKLVVKRDHDILEEQAIRMAEEYNEAWL